MIGYGPIQGAPPASESSLGDVEIATNAEVIAKTAINKVLVCSNVDSLLEALGIGDAFLYEGVIDCAANPNYPAADAGHVYKISVAGKIGGASGVAVTVGDTAFCSVDSTVVGNQAAVGANWNIIQFNIVNASDIIFTAVGNIIATNVQAAIEEVDTEKVTLAGVKADTDIADALTKRHTLGADTSLGTMTADVNMGTHKLTVLSAPSSNGDSIRATAKITEAKLEAADDHVAAANPHSGSAASGANSDITSMTGLSNDGVPLAKVANAASDGANSDITSLNAHSLTGTLSLNEQTILVDAVLTSDHTWTGLTQSITAGEELTFGETAYLKSDGKYWLIDADVEATSKGKLVMATATISADGTGIVLLPSEMSFIRDDSTTEWTVTSAGDEMYLSLTAGELTNDVSGYTTLDIVRICGHMETATVLAFNVDKTYVEVA